MLGGLSKDKPPHAAMKKPSRSQGPIYPSKEEAKPEAEVFDIIEPEDLPLTDDERRQKAIFEAAMEEYVREDTRRRFGK